LQWAVADSLDDPEHDADTLRFAWAFAATLEVPEHVVDAA
jgi:hypothetical protein